jgi:bifunctional DNase/RNase
MSQLGVAIRMLRINPIHNKWELMFEDKAGHYLPVFLDKGQANLIRKEMIKPGSVEPNYVVIAELDFRVDRLESVIVDDLKGGILKTKLIVHHNNKQLQLDCPAEKAIVLALREGIPILMEEKKLKAKAN